MTVEELIAALELYPKGYEVVVSEPVCDDILDIVEAYDNDNIGVVFLVGAR